MARPKGVKELVKRKPRECNVTSQMIGKKYFRLFVIEIVQKGRQPKIKVRCDCGVEKIISAYDIKYRKVRSCGCYHREEMIKRQVIPNNGSAKRRLYNDYKTGARVRSIKFNLTPEDIYNISNNRCFYCDKPQDRELITVGGKIKVNGVDRVDNSKGYTLENCVPCCKQCNLSKGDTSPQIILKAYKFLYEK